ncbi:3-oxoacyl-[acyl-carrier-protein] reductase FabG [mine drainage metagenome]|uniref:3-oxoacyl-[acyl-carrier-protein] reductase FabG n=1 Tax=mine drainage metagenome TaxID=410659 RepID=A0A1J5RNE5_9ZZZZ
MKQNTSRIALITGASRGLGRSVAMHLATQDVGIVATYLEQSAAAEELVGGIKARGGRAVALQLDVGDTPSFGAFAQRLERALADTWQRDRFDFLVNNAGHGVHAAFAQTTEADFDRLMRVHLKGPFFLTQAMLPLLADGGRIVNFSSGLARFTFPGYAAYATMKGGLEVMSRYMARELAARAITVNVIAPGAIETDFGGGAVRDNAQLNAQLAAATALGRVGLPDDVGAAVAALLGDGNRWVTGQRIEVSGGMML